MTTKPILIGIFLINFCGYSQVKNSKIDSLEKQVSLNTKKDTAWIKNLIALEEIYMQYEPKKMGKYDSTILENSQKINYNNGINQGLKLLSFYFINNGISEKALETALKKLEFSKKKNDLLDIIDSYRILTYVYASTNNNLNKALEYAILGKKATLSLPTYNHDRYLYFALSGQDVANVYLLLGKYDAARKEYQEGIDYLEDGFKSAKLSNATSQKMREVVGGNYLGIGDFYISQKKYDLAITYGKKTVELAQKYNVPILLPLSYNIIIIGSINTGQYNLGEKYLRLQGKLYEEKALQINETFDYFQSAIDLYQKRHNFEKAFYFQKKYSALRDSTQGKEVQNKLNDLSIKYESEKKEQENKLLHITNEKISLQNRLFLASILFSIFLLVGSAFFYWQLRKTNKDLGKLNQIKDRLFTIIAHDLKRPANAFQNLIPTFRYLIKKKQYDTLAEIGTQAENIASDMNLILDNLFRWGALQQGKTTVHAQMIELLPIFQDMDVEFRSISELKNISFIINYPENTFLNVDKTILSSVLRNFLSNAFKFTKDGGKVVLEAKSTEFDTQILVIDKTVLAFPQPFKNVCLN